ncbi:DUF2947 domain-containing protein [Shewanella sp. FJAT-51649]|uniref:DUF2947 family protein n=1 Tax=Shewanella sp. FJAT-51649 TaxID=2864210 RepID=UPI001C65DA06|nr:DUF2947 family protein [Shewanella sp. FJAT-51649]QYJ72308.1 DUF2947 domain-containing protein [Shewanella sp. FJAT-51649]
MKKEIEGVFYNDPEMPQTDLNKINILSKESTSEKWTEYVSVAHRHFMEMEEEEWPSKIVAGNNAWYYWLEDWNKNNLNPFTFRLLGLGIPINSALYVFWMKEVGIRTEWGVFCNNWVNFLYEDEGCILVLPEHELALVLTNGSAWLGKRSIAKT